MWEPTSNQNESEQDPMTYSTNNLIGQLLRSTKAGIAAVVIAGLALVACDGGSSTASTAGGSYQFTFDADDMIVGDADACSWRSMTIRRAWIRAATTAA